ncbi:MAG: YtxH domain-containing protein [Bryobacteraceae bacterium]|nr:YtxH domain-containing protein [Bryobacterales bacterium]
MAHDNGGSKLMWFIAGAALGASIALLYAPKSGKDTRRYIEKKSEEGREAIAETGREIYDRGKGLYEKGRKVADEAAGLFERGRKLVRG